MCRQVVLRQGLVDGFSDTDSVITVFRGDPLCQAFPLAHYDLSRVMIRYWTNFAATGDPNGSGLPECPACGPNGQRYMLLGGCHDTSDSMSYARSSR